MFTQVELESTAVKFLTEMTIVELIRSFVLILVRLVSLYILALTSLPHTASLATITSSGSDTAGKVYRLHCTAAVGSEAATVPIIMWSGPNGIMEQMSTPRGVMLERTNTSHSFTSTLKFSPLEVLHKGNYTCRVHFRGNDESSYIYVNVTGRLHLFH